MKNLIFKTSLSAISLMSFVSLAAAGENNDPTHIPEPGTFGMFAAAIAIAIIVARIVKKK